MTARASTISTVPVLTATHNPTRAISRAVPKRSRWTMVLSAKEEALISVVRALPPDEAGECSTGRDNSRTWCPGAFRTRIGDPFRCAFFVALASARPDRKARRLPLGARVIPWTLNHSRSERGLAAYRRNSSSEGPSPSPTVRYRYGPSTAITRFIQLHGSVRNTRLSPTADTRSAISPCSANPGISASNR